MIRVTPDMVVSDREAIKTNALQNQAAQLGIKTQMANQAKQSLGNVLDYYDDKYLMDVLSRGGLDNQEAAMQFMSDFQGVTPENIGQVANQRAQNLQAQGINNQDTLEIAGMAPQQAFQAVNNISSIIQDPRIRNYLARNPARAQQTMASLAPQKKELGFYEKELLKSQMAEDKDRRDEKRGEIQNLYEDVDSRITGITDNYNKVIQLSKAVLNNNRQAVSGALVALVKSGDPNSAVLAGEMAAALNLEGLREAIASGKFSPQELIGVAQQEVAALNPKNINVADLTDVARKYKTAQADSVLDTYNMALEQRSLLPSEGQKMTFSQIRDDRVNKFKNSINSKYPAWAEVVGVNNFENELKAFKKQNPEVSDEEAFEFLGQAYQIYKREGE